MYRELLHVALRGLHSCGASTDQDRAIVVLEETTLALKEWCEDLGLEDPGNLHPRDIVEKRLRRRLDDLLEDPDRE